MDEMLHEATNKLFSEALTAGAKKYLNRIYRRRSKAEEDE